ncbi:MAG: polyisoprenoid-binding protein YceI [Cryomorphaceae bacterium]|jgi:polyisoprenoid-binding protein YceI
MKKTVTFLAAALLSVSAIAGSGEKETYTINTEKSTIFWTGKKVTGEHTGTLAIKAGNLTVQDGMPVAATFDIDMTSIVCTDLKDEGTNMKLVGHLKSDDFFGIEAHPTGKFVATSFTPIKGAKDREANYKIKGTLTLKGISHEIEFDGLIAMKGTGLVSNGSAEFDRAKYDIRYGSGSFFDDLGDKTIYDDVELTFVLSATK